MAWSFRVFISLQKTLSHVESYGKNGFSFKSAFHAKENAVSFTVGKYCFFECLNSCLCSPFSFA